MKIGYACINLSIDSRCNHSCQLKNASQDRLRLLIQQNLNGLKDILQYNISHHIGLYRISSDIIPFASHPVNTLHWSRLFAPHFKELQQMIQEARLIVSMHPGQYTVLNSPNPEVVEKSLQELEYHARFLQQITTNRQHKIVLHIGGVYGDKSAAMKRFVQNFRLLSEEAKKRIIIENDDRSYHIADLLSISETLSIPVVFDFFHHLINPPFQQLSHEDHKRFLQEALATWRAEDGTPKVHYSNQAPYKSKGSHGSQINLIRLFSFLQLLEGQDINIMLESKDKNLSAERIMGVLNHSPEALEGEFQRSKALWLSRGEDIYNIPTWLKPESICYQQFAIQINQMLIRETSNACLQIVLDHFLEEMSAYIKSDQEDAVRKAASQGQMAHAFELCYQLAIQHNIPSVHNSYFFDFLDCMQAKK